MITIIWNESGQLGGGGGLIYKPTIFRYGKSIKLSISWSQLNTYRLKLIVFVIKYNILILHSTALINSIKMTFIDVKINWFFANKFYNFSINNLLIYIKNFDKNEFNRCKNQQYYYIFRAQKLAIKVMCEAMIPLIPFIRANLSIEEFVLLRAIIYPHMGNIRI